MAARARVVTGPQDTTVWFWCAGCDTHHAVTVKSAIRSPWTWNGSVERPTFEPSVLVNRRSANPTVHICHSYVRDGRIQYLSDSTHRLAGQTVDLDPIADSFGQ